MTGRRYLLDTNVLSDLVRNPRGRAAGRIRRLRGGEVCTSIIVAAELRYGAAKRGAGQIAERVSELLRRIDVIALEAPVDVVYGELRAQLARAGTLIGPNDMLIAAQAVCLGLTLVTDNEREFARVPGLAVENWLR